MTPTVKFQRPDRLAADEYDVLIDGEVVGSVRKRQESYTGIKGGGRYTYWDFRLPGERSKFVQGGSTRGKAVAEALVKLGKDEAAFVADKDYAEFQISKRKRGF
jgi:hypothetical protein